MSRSETSLVVTAIVVCTAQWILNKDWNWFWCSSYGGFLRHTGTTTQGWRTGRPVDLRTLLCTRITWGALGKDQYVWGPKSLNFHKASRMTLKYDLDWEPLILGPLLSGEFACPQEESVGQFWLSCPFWTVVPEYHLGNQTQPKFPKEISRLMCVAPSGRPMFLPLLPSELMLGAQVLKHVWLPKQHFYCRLCIRCSTYQYRWNFHQMGGGQDWICG